MARNIYDHRIGRWFSGIMAMLVGMMVLTASYALGEQAAVQRSFGSPGQAVAALVAAVLSNHDAGLLDILGPGSEGLIFSGDQVADQNGRARFLKAYEAKHSIVQEGEGRAIFLVGEKDYPFPIPIVRQGEAWIFDTPAGKEEILDRRIGRNELHTIEVMYAYTDAQREYACMQRDGGGREFARRLTSSEGQRDGLFWEAAEAEAESPLGPLIARATEEGYTGGLDEIPPEPFHGYFFKILTAQGEHADGGAFDYVADGKMILGFALVAYPAKYGASGIMTFMVNQEGVIFEQDLGEDTTAEAESITSFDPGPGWHLYEEPAEQ